MRKRLKYSQNFLRDFNLVRSLVSKSNISKSDTVLEIGAGKGIITAELLDRAGKIISYELDKQLLDTLAQKFQGKQSLELKLKDFLNVDLPNHPYKIFSNIPFNITSAIIKKITLENDFLQDAYLIIQKEAAMKFTGKPLDTKNSQLSVILHPWFEVKTSHNFNPNDFKPRPSVDIVLLEIHRRDNPLIAPKQKNLYEDFITFTFSQFKSNVIEGLSGILGRQKMINLARKLGFSPSAKPSGLNFSQWISLFEVFSKLPKQRQKSVRGAFDQQLKQQENIEKINRTRVDTNWKKFRSH